MKKAILLILSLFCLSALHAQTFTSPHITVVSTDTMYHDSVTCQSHITRWYTITIDSSFVGDTVRVVDTFGNLLSTDINYLGSSPWTFTTSIYDRNMTDYIFYSGTSGVAIPGYALFWLPAAKVVCRTNTLAWIPNNDSLNVTNPCVYGSIDGAFYVDNNGNCTFDSGDETLHEFSFHIHENFTSGVPAWDEEVGTSAAGSSWIYNWFGQESWLANYTVSLPSYYYFIYSAPSCAPGSYTFTTLPQTGLDFPLQCLSNLDLQCYALSSVAIRPYTPFQLHPYVSNMGCDSASGELTLVKDSRAIYDASLSGVPADIVVGDTLKWFYSGLSNRSSLAYWNSFIGNIHLTPDGTVAAGDTLCFRVFTNIPSLDVNPANNDNKICLPVVYSYDPNEKEVTPRGAGPQGYILATNDTLTYTLHFQNTGTAEAYDVAIIDTLDSHLNAASLRILGTSHEMYPEWLAPNVVKFVYQNIFLPDSSTNEPASHGSVRFSVALNHPLSPGTQIRNTGYIYFDANAPVITNTTLNTIAYPNGSTHTNSGTGITEVTDLTNGVSNRALTLGTKIYPNPATDHIVVETLVDAEMSITDMNGISVIGQRIGKGKTTIDVGKLPAGVYTVKTINERTTTVNRFSKY